MLFTLSYFTALCFHFLVLTLYPGLFCYLNFCHGLSFYLSIIFVSFKLSFIFLEVLSLVTKIKTLMGKKVVHLPALFSEKCGLCVSCRLAEVGDHAVQISVFIFHCLNGCESTFYLWLGWLPWILRRVWKFVITMSMVVSKCHLSFPSFEPSH